MREADIDPLVDQICKVRPVPEVPGTAIDLVEDKSRTRFAGELPHDVPEYGTVTMSGRLNLFAPLLNEKSAGPSVSFNGRALLSEGGALNLPRGRDADVGNVCFHDSGC